MRDGCEGPVLASQPLPQATDADGFITLEAPLRVPASGRADLCMTFSGDTRPQMWVLQQATLRTRD